MKGFLLGDLVDKERVAFEDDFLSDQQLFEELRVVEDELVESYVRGWMSDDELAKFESNYLRSDSGRKKVEAFRAFQRKIEERNRAINAGENREIVEAESFWKKLAAVFITPQFAASFAVLVLAVIGWVVYQNIGRDNPEIVKDGNTNVVETPSLTPAPQANIETDGANSAAPNNAAVNTNVPNKKPTPKTTPTKTPVSSPTKTPEKVKTAPKPVLALFPGTVRSGGKNNVLKLPKGAKAATLLLNIEANDYKTYQAQLTNADGNVLFERKKMKARGKRIGFNIPAKYLKKGDYIVKLNGKNDAGENESVTDFQFRVN